MNDRISLPQVTIRRADPADAPLLTELALRSKASHGYDSAFMEMCRAELFIAPSTMQERDIWVALADGGDIAGFFGLWPPVAGLAEVDPIFVEPRCIGQGVGRALWQHLETRALAMGAARLGLDADPNAVGFYRRMGCIITGASDSASIPGRKLPRMEKSLAERLRAVPPLRGYSPLPD